MRAIKLFFLTIVSLSIFSCSNRDQVVSPVDRDRLSRVIEAESILSEINDLIFDTDNISKDPKLDTKFCGSYSVKETPTTRTITFDFKETCPRRTGNIKGKMTLKYRYNNQKPRRLIGIDTNFDELTINDIKVKGNERREVTYQNNTRILNINANVDITWKDKTTATYKGTRTIKRKKGSIVTETTGSLDAKLRNNKEYKLEIMTPLLKNLNCRFYAKGKLRVIDGANSGVLDYGNGACDNKAVFTNKNGDKETIIL